MKHMARSVLLSFCLVLFGASTYPAKESASFGDGTHLPVNMRLFLRGNELLASLVLVNNTGQDIEVPANMLEQSPFGIYEGSFSTRNKIPPDRDVVNFAVDREKAIILEPLDLVSATVSVSEYYQLKAGVEYIIFFHSYVHIKIPGDPVLKLVVLKSNDYIVRMDEGKLIVHDYDPIRK